MFRLKSLFCCTLLFIFISCKGQVKDRSINAVAFYNLENLYDPADDPDTDDKEFTPDGSNHYTEKVYREKLHNMAFALSKIAVDKNTDGPVLIGLAEIENKKVLLDLIAQPELKKRNLKIIHFDAPDNRGIDVAMLYHPKYFTLVGAKALPVNITRNGKMEHTRDVLYVVGKLGNDTFHVFVNHWPSRRQGVANSAWKRAQAAMVSKKVIDGLMRNDKNTKCIVMGDLNDDPADASVVKTLGAEGNRQKVLPGGLYNPWMEIYEKGTGTAAYQGQWNLFDQIIVSYGFISNTTSNWKFYKAEIFSPSFLKNDHGKYKDYPHRSFSGHRWIKGYSDHYPTILYLVK